MNAGKRGAVKSGARTSALHVYAVLMVVATLILITAGGLVTSTGSGLAVPDWPLSYGMLFPPMVGGILYEHGHRMIATAIGVLTIVLAVWLKKSEPRLWVRRLGLFALAAVITQGLLGGMTVLFLLPTAISVLHACVAQTFFCLIVTIAVVTSPAWLDATSPARRGGAAASPRLVALTTVTTAMIYVQLVLGALTRHTKAGLAISDFPLANGHLIPPFTSSLIAIQFVHRMGALAVSVLVVLTAFSALAGGGAPRVVRRGSLLLLALLVAQITFGALTVLTKLAVLPATAHVTTGAALLGVSLTLALMSRRVLIQPVLNLNAATRSLVDRPATSGA